MLSCKQQIQAMAPRRLSWPVPIEGVVAAAGTRHDGTEANGRQVFSATAKIVCRSKGIPFCVRSPSSCATISARMAPARLGGNSRRKLPNELDALNASTSFAEDCHVTSNRFVPRCVVLFEPTRCLALSLGIVSCNRRATLFPMTERQGDDDWLLSEQQPFI